MSLYDDASLVMIPSGYKDGKLYSVKPSDGAGDFTFTRGSNLAATRVDEDGLIEKGRENLLLHSNQFNNWINSNTTETSGQSGYDGTNDAWLLEKSAASGFLWKSFSGSGVYSLSLYAKAGTLNSVFVLILASGGNGDGYFNLSTGTVGTFRNNAFDAQIEDIGGGWYRCSLIGSYTSISQVRIYPANDESLADTSGSIYIQDAQLELGLVATDYIETGATTAQAGILEDMPRLDYSGGATCPSLLLEPQRTNLIANSEYFDGYSNSGSTDEPNATTSPEGLTNATFLKEDTSTGIHFLNQSTSEPAGVYTASVFAKANGRDWLFLNIAAAGSYAANFNLSNGTTGTIQSNITSATIEDYGNGWYRCSITADTTVAAVSPRIAIYLATGDNATSYTGDGTSGMYLYGFQLEAGSYATSYIPTYGTSVTRGVDATGVTGASSIIGQSEGTIYWEGYIDVSKSNYGYFPRLFSVSSTSLNWVALLLTTSNQLRAQYVVNGSVDVQITHQISTSGNYKIAFAYNDNDFNCFVNGVSVGTNTTTTTTIALNDIYLGMENGQALAPTSQDTKQAVLFDIRLTNTELAALTTL